MFTNASNLITLSCPSCGAKLDITPNLNRFACSYCGQEHIVNRTGGTISLAPVVDAIHEVKRGIDKTAAELAIVRLEKEISTLLQERQNILKQSPTPTINSIYRGSFFIGSFLILTILLIHFLPSSWNLGFPFFGGCFAIGIILLFIGVLPIFLLSRNKRIWKQTTEPRVNALAGQISEKQAELKRNQNLVKY